MIFGKCEDSKSGDSDGVHDDCLDDCVDDDCRDVNDRLDKLSDLFDNRNAFGCDAYPAGPVPELLSIAPLPGFVHGGGYEGEIEISADGERFSPAPRGRIDVAESALGGGRSCSVFAVDVHAASSSGRFALREFRRPPSSAVKSAVAAVGEIRSHYLLPSLGWLRRGCSLGVLMPLGRSNLAEYRLAHGPCTAEEVLVCAYCVLSGLDALHTRGLAHRDIRLENIVVMRCGCVVLIDFDLVHLAHLPAISHRHLAPPADVVASVGGERGGFPQLVLRDTFAAMVVLLALFQPPPLTSAWRSLAHARATINAALPALPGGPKARQAVAATLHALSSGGTASAARPRKVAGFEAGHRVIRDRVAGGGGGAGSSACDME